MYGRKGSTTHRYGPALGIDRSDWNDPDYMMLALVGAEQPGRECEEDPPEASSHHRAQVARAARGGDTLLQRVLDVRDDLASLQEDVEDLEEPVREFVLFDQCMFTIAANQHGIRDGDVGYLFGSGGKRRWPALTLDLSDSSVRLPVSGVPRRRATEHRMQRGRRGGSDRRLSRRARHCVAPADAAAIGLWRVPPRIVEEVGEEKGEDRRGQAGGAGYCLRVCVVGQSAKDPGRYPDQGA
jgi:hypothetical protein